MLEVATAGHEYAMYADFNDVADKAAHVTCFPCILLLFIINGAVYYHHVNKWRGAGC